MKCFFKRVYIVFIVAIFFVIAIYLPEIDAGILERQNVNRYTLVKQDKQEPGIHYDLPLVDKLSLFFSMGFSTEILSIRSIGSLESQDGMLLEELQSQISIWEKADIIPTLVDMERLKNSFDEALYYNISNAENPNIVVPVWKLTFFESESFRYQFVVDANTYKIYSVSILGYDFYDFWLEKGIFITDIDKMGKEKLTYIRDKMGSQLSDYYEAESSEILYMSSDENFALEGILCYSISDYDKSDRIPFYIYYYPEYKEEMEEGMFIGITSDREGTAIEYNTSSYSK